MKRPKLFLAFDFDGTLAVSDWPYMERPRWLARPILKWLRKRNHVLTLWTNREDEALKNARLWLEQNGIGYYFFDYYNQNTTELKELYNSNPRKIGADWYFDDKAGFTTWLFVPLRILWLEYRNRWRCL